MSVDSDTSCCFLISRLDFTCILGLISLAVLVFALIAPQWLEGTHNQRSSFVRLNPWDLCVTDLTLRPASGDNVTLHGCYTVWDTQLLTTATPALLQDWYIVVPATLLLASSLSLSARAILFMIWFKKRQVFPLKLGALVMCICSLFDLLAGLLLLTTTMTFAAAVLSSPWLTPDTSSLSWGWAACLTSSWAHVAVAALMAREAFKEKHRRVQNETFIRNLDTSN